jgi:hypothetical protein
MNNPLLKKLLPHIIAIVVFLVISALFCKPVLDGNVMNQHDNVGWKGMAQDAFEYKKAHGHFPLWNTHLFSGMPNYQVAMEGKNVIPNMVNILSFGTPKPINYFFLACICFYILCLALRVRPIIGMMCAIAYAFSTYNPVLIAAGHDSQMLATAFMPLPMAGLIFTYTKKYWLGLALTTYGAYQLIGFNHMQITYYFFLIAALITIAYIVKWFKEKETTHMGIALGISLIAGIIGLAGNAMTLKTTSEYAKYTMRGGKNIEVTDSTVKEVKTSGLDTSYAFEYSLGKAETFTLLMPNAFGGGSYATFTEDSKIAKRLSDKGMQGEQIAPSLTKYWGTIFTAGPAYLGVFIFLLGVLGFVVVRSPLRWGLLAATLLGIFMTWGKYFAGFNVFLFEHLPLYNKFRSPSFAQVIPQFTMGMMAALTIQQLLFVQNSKEWLQKNFKTIAYTLAGVFVLAGLVYFGMDYNAADDPRFLANVNQQTGNDEVGRILLSALKAERKSMFGGQILRALGIALLGAAVLFAYVKNWIKAIAAAILLLIISTLDITLTSHKYFNNDNDQYSRMPDNMKLFVSKDDYESSNFAPSQVDQQILQDKSPHYRVLNMLGTSSAGTFSESRTSYFHRSVGGYHPAKLRIYQDVIEKYFTSSTNPQVMNMLDTKYLITRSPFTGADTLVVRDDAYGPAWLVKNVKIVDGPVQAITDIGTTNLKETAIVQKDFSKLVVQPQWDSSATITLKSYDNDAIEYQVNSAGPQFAVFSEVYYPKGWNAYIDGKRTDYVNANYVLRGLSIPAGQHTIKFVFEPASVRSGNTITLFATILIAIILVGGLFMAWKNREKVSPE